MQRMHYRSVISTLGAVFPWWNQCRPCWAATDPGLEKQPRITFFADDCVLCGPGGPSGCAAGMWGGGTSNPGHTLLDDDAGRSTGGWTHWAGYSNGCSCTGIITGCGRNTTVSWGGKWWTGGAAGRTAGVRYTRGWGGRCCTGTDGGKRGAGASGVNVWWFCDGKSDFMRKECWRRSNSSRVNILLVPHGDLDTALFLNLSASASSSNCGDSCSTCGCLYTSWASCSTNGCLYTCTLSSSRWSQLGCCNCGSDCCLQQSTTFTN